jgi:hypothetical protein
MQEVKTHGVGYIRIATDLMAAKTDIVWFALGIFLAAHSLEACSTGKNPSTELVSLKSRSQR